MKFDFHFWNFKLIWKAWCQRLSRTINSVLYWPSAVLLLKQRILTLAAKLSSSATNLKTLERPCSLQNHYVSFPADDAYSMGDAFCSFNSCSRGGLKMCNSIPDLSTACRGSIVEVAKITSVSMKTNQYSVTRSSCTGKYATRHHCLTRNLSSSKQIQYTRPIKRWRFLNGFEKWLWVIFHIFNLF